MRHLSPTWNAGGEGQFRVGIWENVDKVLETFRSLLEFDLSSIPAGSTITAATFECWAAEFFIDASHTYIAERIIRTDWVEMEATWNIYKTGNNWTTAGCGNNGADYSASQSNAIVIGGTDGIGGWKSNNLLTLVSDAWDNRSKICRFRLNRNDAVGDEGYCDILSDESTEPPTAPWPYLLVTYTPPAATFTPRVMIF